MAVTKDSPLTALQQRLAYIDQHPDREWSVIVDNVPVWSHADRMRFRKETPAGDPYTYAPCAGLPPMVDAVLDEANRHHRTVIGPENVLVTNGAMHAIRLLADRFRANGRRVLVQRPVLSAVPRIFRDCGLEVDYFEPTMAGMAEAKLLTGAAHPELAMVYVNSPNNPTGEVISQEVLEELTGVVSRSSAALLCDQVYDAYQPASGDVPTIIDAAVRDGRVFYLNSMSKNYGMPGLRIGWIVGEKYEISQLSGRLERENVAVNGPAQDFAAVILRYGNQSLRDAVAITREHLVTEVRSLPGLEVPQAMRGLGGSSLVVAVSVSDIETFADELLVRHSIAVTTPSNFAGIESHHPAWIRVPLGYPGSVVANTLTKISEILTESSREYGAVS